MQVDSSRGTEGRLNAMGALHRVPGDHTGPHVRSKGNLLSLLAT